MKNKPTMLDWLNDDRPIAPAAVQARIDAAARKGPGGLIGQVLAMGLTGMLVGLPALLLSICLLYLLFELLFG